MLKLESIAFRSLAAALFASTLLPAGCNGFDGSSSLSPISNGVANVARPPKRAVSTIDWTFFNLKRKPQVETAGLPLRPSSFVTNVNGNATNELVCAGAIRFARDKVWVMNLSPCRPRHSSTVAVYALPLTSESQPEKSFYLMETIDAGHMTFDASGNLWVSSQTTNAVYEYTGPFNVSGQIAPRITLSNGLKTPEGLGFDRDGNLYVADRGATTQHAVSVFKAPISSKTRPYFLKGVAVPGGLAFDANGNLFVSSNGKTGAVAMYAAGRLKAGDGPSVIDSTGLAQAPYGADLNFDAGGNLYDADCGSNPGIYSYPTATKKFTPRLAPSFYSNADIVSVRCVWGLASH
jgi:hypothetical protein